MKKASYQRGKPVLDLVEEAAHELRRTPVSFWLAYYAGTVPFVLGLLYFWADMSYGSQAARHCGALALMLTVLFVWMKCWQNVFATGLQDRLMGQIPLKWNARRVVRVVLLQAAIQPSKLLLLPLAALTVLPFPWTLAFYESVTVAGNGAEPVALREIMRRAARQAGAWPGQNVLLIFMLLLLGGILWLNAMAAVFSLPYLLKLLLGLDTNFTQSGHLAVFNTTFFGTTFALAALILDPLVKTIYGLRSFYSEARRDGADLVAELALVRRSAGILAALLVWLVVAHPSTTRGESPPNAGTPAPLAQPAQTTTPAASPAELEQALKTTLAQDKYTWRLPREKAEEADDAQAGWFHSLFHSLGVTLADWARTLFEWLHDLIHWLRQYFKPAQPAEEDAHQNSRAWMNSFRVLAVVLLVAVAAVLAVLLWRYGRTAWQDREVATAEVLPAQPDLTDENLTASQLPEDEWLKLARELAAKGELRLALRALYLASLAHLAARDLVSIARFKSNRDYQLEVARRARAKPELRLAFDENVAMFDCAWYGLYAVSGEGFRQFQINLERIRAC